MEEQLIECKPCGIMPPAFTEYMTRTCNLCGKLNCSDCLNEAGLCVPCSEKLAYSREEAIPV